MDTFAPMGAAQDALRPKFRCAAGTVPRALATKTAVATTAMTRGTSCPSTFEEAAWNA